MTSLAERLEAVREKVARKFGKVGAGSLCTILGGTERGVTQFVLRARNDRRKSFTSVLWRETVEEAEAGSSC